MPVSIPRALCETYGLAANFDTLTGTGLRDRACTCTCTWTAGGYLLLDEAHESWLGKSGEE